MLIEIDANCPACQNSGRIRVSDQPGAGSATLCPNCREQIISMTLEDGHVALMAGEKRGLAFRHAGGATGEGEERTVVLPPLRFGIRNANYAETPHYDGMTDADFASGGILPLGGDLLFRPDGSRRPDRTIIDQIGWRGLWQAQLAHEIALRLSGPPPMTHAPKVFLSYRWQDDARNDWVADLGARLKARGYDVFRDRDLPQDRPPNVPDITSRVADCRYFVAIVDPGYLARLGDDPDRPFEDGWVWDEFQLAIRLSEAGLVRLFGFWRDGPVPEAQFQLAQPGKMGNLIDVRTCERLEAILDQVFPPLDGVAGAGTGSEARAALLRSHQAFLAGDPAGAIREAGRIADLVPGSADGWLQIIRIVHRTGDHALGLRAAEAALAVHPTSVEVLLDASAFAAAAGAAQKSAAFAARVLDQHHTVPADVAEAHAHMASALDDMGRVDAALGHARTAARLAPERSINVINLGYIQRRVGDFVSAAETLSDGLRKFPDDLQLLENYAAAAAEAGLLDAAEKLIMHLHQKGGDDNTVGGMARAVIGARETGQPPRFIRSADLPEAVAIAECDTCRNRLLLAEGDRDLCAMCGAPGQPPDGPCGYCAAPGRQILLSGEADVHVRCPFCRQGCVVRQPLDQASNAASNG